MPSLDLYRVLQVDPAAEPEVIQAAFRRLAQKYPPDAGGGSEERMAELNAAYAVLGDASRRAAYDRLQSGHPAGPHGVSGPVFATSTSTTTSTRPTTGRPPAAPRAAPPPQDVSPDWRSGRNPFGSGYDPTTMGRAQDTASAGPPPGQPWGSVLTFGRYAGWSLGEIARRDLEFLEWLDRMTIGRPYRLEIDTLLRRAGRRRTASDPAR